MRALQWLLQILKELHLVRTSGVTRQLIQPICVYHPLAKYDTKPLAALSPHNCHFACMTAIEDLICLLCLVERKVMCHHHFWMKIPAHKVFDKFRHLWQAAHPRPVQRKLLVYQQWTWFKRDRSSLADKHDTGP